MPLMSGPFSGSFERHPKTRALFRIEKEWTDEKGRPSIVFPKGIGKDLVEPGIEYEYLIEETNRFYVLSLDGQKPRAHRIYYARRFAVNGKPLVSPEEWAREVALN